MLGTLVTEIVKQGLMVRQDAYIHFDTVGNLLFEVCLSLQQLKGGKESERDVAFQQGEEGFDQNIGLYQGPVEIHAKRNISCGVTVPRDLT